MSSSSSDRFRLCMFDLRRGQKEGHEFEKILYFYLPYLSLLIQPFVIGINEWLITSTRLGEQLENLRKELQVRESSQKQLRDELLKVEGNIIRAVSVVKTKENMEVEKSLTDNSPKNFERVNKVLTAKDDEIARLRDELKIISAHWKFKTKELEEYVENHRRIDQDLKKKVLKLEFCLRETRIQTQKLQKMGERNDVAIQ